MRQHSAAVSPVSRTIWLIHVVRGLPAGRFQSDIGMIKFIENAFFCRPTWLPSFCQFLDNCTIGRRPQPQGLHCKFPRTPDSAQPSYRRNLSVIVGDILLPCRLGYFSLAPCQSLAPQNSWQQSRSTSASAWFVGCCVIRQRSRAARFSEFSVIGTTKRVASTLLAEKNDVSYTFDSRHQRHDLCWAGWRGASSCLCAVKFESRVK